MNSCVCVCVKDRLHKRKRETTRTRKDETVRLSLIRNYKLSFTTGTPARGPTRGPTHAPTEAECYRRGSVSAGSTRTVHEAETTSSRRITTSARQTVRPRSSSRTGSLCRKHSDFPRSRGDESPRLCSVRQPLPSSAALRPRQIAIPATATSCSLYRPTSRPSCRLYSLSLSDRDPLRSSRHASSFYISRLSLIFVQLLTPHAQKKGRFARLPSYVCKGRFRRPFPCFRPWTVFFTTTS